MVSAEASNDIKVSCGLHDIQALRGNHVPFRLLHVGRVSVDTRQLVQVQLYRRYLRIAGHDTLRQQDKSKVYIDVFSLR
jgi:hypothetical protein